jgi:hypothetical protein
MQQLWLSRTLQGDTMKTPARGTALFGDLVAAAFDGAAGYSSDPAAVTRLATRTVGILLDRSRWLERTRKAVAGAGGTLPVASLLVVGA